MSQRSTSQQAYQSIQEHLNRLQERVHDEIRWAKKRGRTCDELEVILNLPHQTVSPRVYELHRRGYITDSGQRRPTRSGRNAIVWVLGPNKPKTR